ncbi:MAG: pyruvate/2-oxoglutarate dehydrogenase complex dihydrolipoamide acyltransferase (E2) component [Myxococcota bacterium]|jgi:pyruvate/2-oxoglutarate dehydrogenase complex dihydrolipoamide acyltransferase (E2) component
MSERLSVVRRFLLWWFDPPNSPWVSANVSVDFSAARAYLATLAEQEGPRVTVQHLLSGAIGRTLAEAPDANARIIGGRIVYQDSVGVVAPVNLLGHAAGKKRELSFAVTEDVHRRSLREIAVATRAAVASERADKITNPVARSVIRAMERAPLAVSSRGLELLARAMERRPFADKVYAQAPFTTGLTNPGAAIGEREGLLFRGGSVNLPTKLVHVGTLWGITPVQDEVIAVGGVPTVRPMLPVMLVFDHRLVDGVRASQVLLRFFDILQDPATIFGDSGRTEGPPVRKPR